MTKFRDALIHYLESAVDISEGSRRKLGYLATSWEKRTSNPSIETIGPDTFSAYRLRCRSENLAAITIERSIGDVLTVLKANGLSPDRGRSLKLEDPDPQCPSLHDLGTWYMAAADATSPQLDWCSAGDYLRSFVVVAYWTGLRLADLFSLTRDGLLAETIIRQANKTKKRHEIPSSAVVRRHVERLPQRNGALFSAGSTCPTHLRDWMMRVSLAAQVNPFGPQNLRVGAVNAWRDAGGAEAAGIIHGESLGGRGAIRWYLQRSTPLNVLTLAAPRFIWPAEFLLPAERDNRLAAIESVVALAKRLSLGQIDNLRKCAIAFAD